MVMLSVHVKKTQFMIKSIYFNIKLYFSTGHERTLLAKKNVAISILLRGLSIVLGYIIVPITIDYVNPTQYGVWLTLSSVISWFTFFDIGLSNGLKNKIAENNALGNFGDSKVYVSTTYAILTILSSVIFIAFFVINYFVNWNQVLNAPVIKGESLNNLALVLFGLFCLQFVLQTINTILIASHAVFKSSFITLIGQFVSLVVIFLLSKTVSGSLVIMVLVLSGAPLLVNFIASIFYFENEYQHLKPALKYVNFKYAKNLLSVGGIFFLVQIGGLIIFQTDNIVITQLFGPSYVTTFNLIYKLFFAVSMGFAIVMGPFWSAFTDAYHKNDLSWIKGVFKKMYKYWFYCIGLILVILLSSPFIIKIWVGNNIIIPYSLSISMAIYTIGFCWMLIHSSLLNGIGKIKVQLYLYIGSAIINIPLAIVLGNFFGLAGVTASNIVVLLVMCPVLYVQSKKIINGTAKGVWNT